MEVFSFLIDNRRFLNDNVEACEDSVFDETSQVADEEDVCVSPVYAWSFCICCLVLRTVASFPYVGGLNPIKIKTTDGERYRIANDNF